MILFRKKVNFDRLNPRVSGGGGGGRGSVDKLFVTMLLHFVILFNLICNSF